MKSSRIILIFIAVSLILHICIFLIKPAPAEELKPDLIEERLIPVDIALKPEIKPPPAAEQVEKPPELPPPPPEPVKPAEPVVHEEPLPEVQPVAEPAPQKEPAEEPEPSRPPENNAETADSQNTASSSSAQSENPPSTGSSENPFEGLLERIEKNKSSTYPLSARKRGQQGTVYVKLVLDKDGNMLSADIIKKSSYSSLNSAALKLINKIMETPYPHGLGKIVNLRIPITYKLN